MIKVSRNNISKYFFMLLLLLFWGRDHVVSYFKTVLLKLPYVYLVEDYIIPCIFFVCLFGALSYIVKAITYKDIIFLLCAGIAYCLNLLVYKATREYLLDLSYKFWITIFPIYFIGLRIEAEEDMPILYYVSMFNIWMLLVVTFMFGTPMSDERSLYQGAMGRAYNLLPHVMVLFIYAFDKPNFWNVSTVVVGALYLLTCGTRGAVLCLFAFVVLFILLYKPIKRHIALYSIIFILMILTVSFYREILLGMEVFAREIGMSERMFSKLLSGSFFVSNSRDVVKATVIEGIADNPILGYGIAGDRALAGIYVHNIFWELIASYGVIGGLLLFSLIMVLIISGYRKAATPNAQKLILLLFCSTIIKLFMSSTYLEEELFFLLLGLCVNQIRRRAIDKRKDYLSMEKMQGDFL